LILICFWSLAWNVISSIHFRCS